MRSRLFAKLVGLLALFVAGVGPAAWARAETRPGSASSFVGEGFSRRTIYHSPQKPGDTSWVGAMVLSDGDLMVCFTQATGPIEGRPAAPRALREKLDVPAGYDFTGLDLREVYLRSHDAGAHWAQVSSTAFRGMGASAFGGGATAALADGDILRRVNGWDLMQNPDIPHTAYLQRSTDGAKTWGRPQVLLDPAQFVYQISRIRTLHDGRLIATGQMWPTPAQSSHKDLEKVTPQLLVMTSADAGRTWRQHHVVPPEYRQVRWDEWDEAELPGGDLLCVFRRPDPKNARREVRWQGLLKRNGTSWRLERFRPAPFPHSGHPELLATREGIVLHIATTGIDWTADRGESWAPLEIQGFAGHYRSRYYPRSFQTGDGRIYVFGHNGWDNRYGEFDQSIDMDTFRLVKR
jgi:hypothetical protein